MELSELRRRVRGVIEDARRAAAERRTRNDEAARAYEAFLPNVAAAAFHAIAQALAGEGRRFRVLTPGDAVRLAPEFGQEEYIELALDTTGDDPALVLRTSRGRGRRHVTSEQPVLEGRPIGELVDDDVIEIVLPALAPFLER
jgi:hypothetical protein